MDLGSVHLPDLLQDPDRAYIWRSGTSTLGVSGIDIGHGYDD
jgi:hypothetical protein